MLSYGFTKLISGERREVVVEEEEGEDAGPSGSNGRPQYMSANCVVFTNYTGDVQAVVEEHFTRALNYARDVKDNIVNTKGEFNSITLNLKKYKRMIRSPLARMNKIINNFANPITR